MKIMTWGDGFIGKHLPYPKIEQRLSIDPMLIGTTLDLHKPDVIINCIGFCGHPNIDECETKKTKTYYSNVIMPALLASECEKAGIHLIHIGSGCIFTGPSPHQKENKIWNQYSLNYSSTFKELGWREDDFANPQSFYSKTKYACDLAIGSLPNVTTLRIRMPISPKNDPRNFINKIRGYKQVINIPNSVTMLDDLVRCVDWVARYHMTGIYHVVNPQPITATQVMKEFQKYDKNHTFEIITEDQLNKITFAKRSNCILDTTKLNKAGFFMMPSNEALEQCMINYIKNI